MGAGQSRAAQDKRIGATVAGLVQRGFRLLSFDFDKTIVACHTGGQWAESADSLAKHVRLDIAALMLAASQHNLQVAVVTFSGQVDLIRNVLQLAVGNAAANKIIIRGADGSWDPDAAVAATHSREEQDEEQNSLVARKAMIKYKEGKNACLCSVFGEMEKKNNNNTASSSVSASAPVGGLWQPGQSILIDDDRNSIMAAQACGVAGIWLDLSVPCPTDPVLKALEWLGQTPRLIFLDVDGVLNSRESRDGGPELCGDEWDMQDEKLLCNLSWLVRRTCGEIVLSSTWRLQESDCDRLTGALERHGLEVIGSTSDMSLSGAGDRGDEIREWVAAFQPSHCGRPDLVGGRAPPLPIEPPWVALDDMDLTAMNPCGVKAPNFVHTDDAVGLVPEKAREAADKLMQAAVSQLPGYLPTVFTNLN
jgi:hypothetical protein